MKLFIYEGIIVVTIKEISCKYLMESIHKIRVSDGSDEFKQNHSNY